MSDRVALLLGSYAYTQEPKLQGLRGPPNDIAALESVLGSPDIGGFLPLRSTNEPAATMLEHIEGFLTERQQDDVVLLYFSGHAVRDYDNEEGRLYLATTDTRLGRLRSTAILASDVNELLQRCRARQKLLILDCCHSGVWARDGMPSLSGGTSVGTRDCFEDRSLAVLTACDAFQYAFEDGQLRQGDDAATQSYLTRSLVEGLFTGSADRDGDGWVTFDELYDHIHEQVRARTPNQTPSQTPCLWTLDRQGRLVVARGKLKAAKLTAQLSEAFEDTRPAVRKSAIDQLLEWVGEHPGRALAARQTLERLCKDDSDEIKVAARQALERRAWTQHGTIPTSAAQIAPAQMAPAQIPPVSATPDRAGSPAVGSGPHAAPGPAAATPTQLRAPVTPKADGRQDPPKPPGPAVSSEVAVMGGPSQDGPRLHASVPTQGPEPAPPLAPKVASAPSLAVPQPRTLPGPPDPRSGSVPSSPPATSSVPASLVPSSPAPTSPVAASAVAAGPVAASSVAPSPVATSPAADREAKTPLAGAQSAAPVTRPLAEKPATRPVAAKPVTRPLAEKTAQPRRPAALPTSDSVTAAGDKPGRSDSGTFERPARNAAAPAQASRDTAEPQAPASAPLARLEGGLAGPHLRVLTGARAGLNIRLTAAPTGATEWTVGSKSDRELRFEDSGVSALHATLVTEAGRWKLIDQMSADGTYVNGKRSNIAFLSGGDRLRFGSVECIFHAPASRARATDAPATQRRRNPAMVIGGVSSIVTLAIAVTITYLLNRSDPSAAPQGAPPVAAPVAAQVAQSSAVVADAVQEPAATRNAGDAVAMPNVQTPGVAALAGGAATSSGTANDPGAGQEVYAQACAACHDDGLVGAPKTGDVARWAPRIAKGVALLQEHAVKGYQGLDGFMPAKGGRVDLSDRAVIDAVDYMVAQSRRAR